jgi:hypothetical protein
VRQETSCRYGHASFTSLLRSSVMWQTGSDIHLDHKLWSLVVVIAIIVNDQLDDFPTVLRDAGTCSDPVSRLQQELIPLDCRPLRTLAIRYQSLHVTPHCKTGCLLVLAASASMT